MIVKTRSKLDIIVPQAGQRTEWRTYYWKHYDCKITREGVGMRFAVK